MNLNFKLETEFEHTKDTHTFRTSLESWKWLNDQLAQKKKMEEYLIECLNTAKMLSLDTEPIERVLETNG